MQFKKCPHCKHSLEQVLITATAHQYAELNETAKPIEYGPAELEDTNFVCCPHCLKKIAEHEDELINLPAG